MFAMGNIMFLCFISVNTETLADCIRGGTDPQALPFDADSKHGSV